MILKKSNPYVGPSYSYQNVVLRLLWQVVWLLLFRPSPPPFHQWRCCLLRCFGAQIHQSCHVYSSALIWAPWNLSMDENACLGPRVICYSMALIKLNKKAIVSQGAHLCTGSHDYKSPDFQLFCKPIVIGENAWICADVFIGPGVAIGADAVIGARSVVFRDQPANTVCSGNPCIPKYSRY